MSARKLTKDDLDNTELDVRVEAFYNILFSLGVEFEITELECGKSVLFTEHILQPRMIGFTGKHLPTMMKNLFNYVLALVTEERPLIIMTDINERTNVSPAEYFKDMKPDKPVKDILKKSDGLNYSETIDELERYMNDHAE